MSITESDFFVKQVVKLSKKYPSVEKDVGGLKNELPKIAFKEFPPLNKRLLEIPISDDCKKTIWRVRLINSDNNKGKRGGYRVFYTNFNSNGDPILLGIFSRSEINDGEYNAIAKDLVDSVAEWGS